MRASRWQRLREWFCSVAGHWEYDDGNLIACRVCHVCVRAR